MYDVNRPVTSPSMLDISKHELMIEISDILKIMNYKYMKKLNIYIYRMEYVSNLKSIEY